MKESIFHISLEIIDKWVNPSVLLDNHGKTVEINNIDTLDLWKFGDYALHIT